MLFNVFPSLVSIGDTLVRRRESTKTQYKSRYSEMSFLFPNKGKTLSYQNVL